MRLRNLLFWTVALLGIVIDQYTKLLTVRNFELGESLPLWEGVFHLTYVVNEGAAFGVLEGRTALLRSLSLLASLGLIIFAMVSRLTRWEQVGFGLILAGALGNGIDRFLNDGSVVDFFHFILINFPVFNFADIFINIGLITILVYMFRQTAPTKNGSGNGNGNGKRGD
ncbi:signal peptidase II [Vacuolonema iberomarrocanum]|uniref:signal peptidase II n=1 Tax=Vacuolonema iberomarrocanum TaxID=3454632 RepID=UPI0019ECA9EF|nr:lipoprotein signal peptidase [filamentous cyanobacterium LEGE 07170]